MLLRGTPNGSGLWLCCTQVRTSTVEEVHPLVAAPVLTGRKPDKNDLGEGEVPSYLISPCSPMSPLASDLSYPASGKSRRCIAGAKMTMEIWLTSLAVQKAVYATLSVTRADTDSYSP